LPLLSSAFPLVIVTPLIVAVTPGLTTKTRVALLPLMMIEVAPRPSDRHILGEYERPLRAIENNCAR